MDKRRMAGPFWVMPYQVEDGLDSQRSSNSCWKVYRTIIRHFFVKEDWEADGEWVIGRFTAQKSAIRKKSGLSRGQFERSWGSLIDASLLVQVEEGFFYLPKYKRKEDEGIRVSEVKIMAQRIEELEETITGLREKITGMMSLIQSMIDKQNAGGQNEAKCLKNEAKCLKNEAGLYNDLERDTDHPPNPPHENIQTGDQKIYHSQEGEGDNSISQESRDRINSEEFKGTLFIYLQNRRVKPKKARDLVENYDPELIRRNIIQIDRDYSAGQKFKDPGAVLVSRIQRGYMPEDGF